jgi:hypothetical protein
MSGQINFGLFQVVARRLGDIAAALSKDILAMLDSIAMKIAKVLGQAMVIL